MLQLRGAHKGRANAAPAIGRRVRPVAVIATLVVLVGAASAYAAVGATRSKRPAPPPATTSLTSPTALDQDRSGQLPVVNINEAPGDFLGKGHDQIASVQNGALTISEAAKYGGSGRTTPTDLRATPNDGFSYYVGGDETLYLPVWGDSTYTSVGASWSLTSVKVAASASNIYMAGATWNDNATNPTDPNSNGYQLHLYKLPHDGSCATAGCPGMQSVNLTSNFPGRAVVATSLAVGVVGGRTLIAVGLSDYGIFIYDENLNPVYNIQDMAVPSGEPGAGEQTPPIRLAFGPPSGSGQGGVLTAGVVSPWLTCYAWQLNSDGSEAHMTRLCGDGVDKNVIASTAVMEVNGAPQAVFGRSDGLVLLVDPSSGAAAEGYRAGTAVTGLTGVTSWDDDPGNQHLVVGLLGGRGEVLQSVNGQLQPIAIGPNGATTGTWEQVRDWFPGYGAGRLQVANDTTGAVSASLASRPDPGYGCWLNASVAGGPGGPVSAFPTQPTPVAAGQSSPAFFIGAVTAGVDGSCASAQAQDKGERSAYVVITPAGDPADQRVVKLRVDQSGVVRVDKQVGGDLNVTLEQAGGGGSWGGWRLRVSGPGDPVAAAPPAVKGQRLTSAPGPDFRPPIRPMPDDPRRPVYRFDVSGAQWGGLGAAGQVTARIPAMTAQGTADGQNWTDLGQLMPATAPTLSSDGKTKTVTLGPASFFWQDDPGATPLTAIRVVSGGQVSDVVELAELPAPPLGTTKLDPNAGVQVTPAAAGGTATPRANGVDQAPLTVELVQPNQGGDLPPSDPRYQRVYYRDADSLSLITGLYAPGDYQDYVAVGPWRGAYPNDGLGRGRTGSLRRGRGSGGRPRTGPARRRGGPGTGPGRRLGGPGAVRSYLVTTGGLAQSLVGRLNDSGTATAYTGSRIAVDARTDKLTASGSATAGVRLSGCASDPCTLAEPDPTSNPPAAVLYQAGGAAAGPVTGLQFTVPAVTGVASLPLQVGTGNAHNLGSATLNVSPTQATLQQAASLFWPSDTIDTALVSSGDLVPALSVPVGSGVGRGRPRPR